MAREGGLGMRFEAQSPTKVVLRVQWYAYPVAPGVSTDTRLKDDIPIPKEVTVVQGKECLTKGQLLRDKIACSVNLEFKSGELDLLLTASSIHGTATAYLPPRRILASGQPQPGELATVRVYAFADDTRSKSVCLSPKKGLELCRGDDGSKTQFYLWKLLTLKMHSRTEAGFDKLPLL
jgi:hypothetical protein